MRKTLAFVFLVAASVAFAYVAAAQQQTAMTSSSTAVAANGNASASGSTTLKSNSISRARTSPIRIEPSVRIEGEKRFHANCSRCHMAPQKLPPRAAATIIRHMRVRATITDDDMRYILAYLTQ